MNFRRVAKIFVRTWPFIRSVAKHLLAFVAASSAIFVFLVVYGLVIVGLVYGGMIAGEPLGSIHIAIYGLDPDIYVNVEALSEEARMTLIWLTVWSTIVMVVVVVGIGLALYYYAIWIFQQINQRMRAELVQRLQAQSLSFHADARTGDMIYRVYQDSAMVTQIIRFVLLEPLMYLGRYLFGLAVLAAFSPLLALLIGVTLLPVLLLGAYFSTRLRISFRTARETNSALTSWIQESVNGIRLIKATGTEPARQQSFEAQSERAFAAAFNARTRLALFGVLAFFVVAMAMLGAQAMSALWSSAGAAVFARDLLLGFGFALWNLGTFTAAWGRFGDGATSMEALLRVWGRAQDMAVGLGRVFEVLDLEPEIQDAADARAMAPFERQVEFDHVGFEYRTGLPVLQEVTLTGEVGSVTAIVGPTGAGKSTMMSLLLRLADPTSGRVVIDGVDVRTLTIDSLRRQVSIATQENILFSDTVAENIRYAVPDASREDVEAAAKVACAHEFIEALPQGYDTPLGERATKLSSGQRQRLVIARAVIKNAPILILDEPTAALDAETEQQVLRNLKAWGRGRCIFLITHRLSTIRQSDQVAYLRNGRLLEIGHHDALMANAQSAYRQFVNVETGAVDALMVAGDAP
ncbi:MAG: ABC transporter ATP-binding protein [Pseudomonadales bacterium]